MKTITKLLLISAFSFQLSAFSQSKAFTCQGRLNDGANPANGSYTVDTSGGGGGGLGAGSGPAFCGGDGVSGSSKGSTSYGDLTANLPGILVSFSLFIGLCFFGLQCLAECRPKTSRAAFEIGCSSSPCDTTERKKDYPAYRWLPGTPFCS